MFFFKYKINLSHWGKRKIPGNFIRWRRRAGGAGAGQSRTLSRLGFEFVYRILMKNSGGEYFQGFVLCLYIEYCLEKSVLPRVTDYCCFLSSVVSVANPSQLLTRFSTHVAQTAQSFEDEKATRLG